MHRLSGFNLQNASDYKLLDKKVVHEMVKCPKETFSGALPPGWAIKERKYISAFPKEKTERKKRLVETETVPPCYNSLYILFIPPAAVCYVYRDTFLNRVLHSWYSNINNEIKGLGNRRFYNSYTSSFNNRKLPYDKPWYDRNIYRTHI